MTFTVGWDLGGAHLKVAVARGGELLLLEQLRTPLWLGLERLEEALSQLLPRLPAPRRHAVTMTGELCDRFPSRKEGVAALLALFRERVAPDEVSVFCLPGELLPIHGLELERAWKRIASANWLASALFLASHLREGLLVDLGSTTTDLIPILSGAPSFEGEDDFGRLASGELLYLGVSRTPLAVLAKRVPFGGRWLAVMNELFATSADLFRITGELPAPLDQDGTADGGPVDRQGSMRRLARMVGLDLEAAPPEAWEGLARFWRERLLGRLTEACFGVTLARLDPGAPLVGAGSGRFLLPEVARRLGRPFLDANRFFSWKGGAVSPADLMPAASLALLLGKRR